MSSRFKMQDGTNVVMADNQQYTLYFVKRATPAGGEPGFQTGALWVNPSGSAGSLLYINRGTITSATWINIA